MAVEQIDRIVIAASGFQSVGEVLPDLDHGDMVWYPVFLDVYADQTKDLDRLCKTIVANFDTESLEPTRQAPCVYRRPREEVDDGQDGRGGRGGLGGDGLEIAMRLI